MAYFKKIETDELYLYMNGKLIYKRWLKTGQSKVFDVMAYDKYTLTSIRHPKQVEQFLNDHVFYGLKNLNNGFDKDSIKYFSAKNFKIVLERVENLGLGIYGIEPWRGGKFYDVKSYQEYSKSPMDPTWYKKAFKEFLKTRKKLQFSASYYIPQMEKN